MDDQSWRVITARSLGDWVEWAARLFFDAGSTAIRERGVFRVALPGGRTPESAFGRISRLCRCGSEPLYEACEEVFFPCGLSWDKVHIYFGDERCVAPDDPASNYRMVREALVDLVPVLDDHVYRIEGELEPKEAADRYNERLMSWMGPKPGSTKGTQGGDADGDEGGLFDLVVLGLGADGHTASLFPKRPLEYVSEPFVGVATLPEPPDSQVSAPSTRVTLTPEALRRTRETCFWVQGAEKAEAVQAAINGDSGGVVSTVVPPGGRVTWVLDEAAGSRLKEGTEA